MSAEEQRSNTRRFDGKIPQTYRARDALYQEFTIATQGKISTPQQLAEAINLPIAVARGERLPRRLEMGKVRSLHDTEGIDQNHFLRLLNDLCYYVVPPQPVSKDEVSANHLELNPALISEKFEGGSKHINADFEVLQRKLIAQEIAKNAMSEAAAEAHVSMQWVGMRKSANGESCLFLTPAGLELYKAMVFGKGGRLEFDSPKAGEVSANHLKLNPALISEKFEGGSEYINADFEALQRQLIAQEMTKNALSEAAAEAHVSMQWVGMRKSANGESCLFLTPAGLELYKAMVFGKGGRLEFDSPKAGEVSAHYLERNPTRVSKGFEGNSGYINADFEAIRQQLIAQEMAKNDMSEAGAEAYVSKQWVGMRKSVNGKPCLHLTPAGLELYRDMVFGKGGRLEFDKRVEGEASASYLSLNPKLVRDDFQGNLRDIKVELSLLQQRLIAQEMAKNDMSEAGAEAYVSKQWVGMRKPESGGASLHVTPAGLELYRDMVFGKGGRLEFEKPKADELSANQLMLNPALVGEGFSKHKRSINGDFAKLKRQLISQEVERGKSPEEAETFVSSQWVGMRKQAYNIPCLHVTPAGLELYRDFSKGRRGWSAALKAGDEHWNDRLHSAARLQENSGKDR